MLQRDFSLDTAQNFTLLTVMGYFLYFLDKHICDIRPATWGKLLNAMHRVKAILNIDYFKEIMLRLTKIVENDIKPQLNPSQRKLTKSKIEFDTLLINPISK